MKARLILASSMAALAWSQCAQAALVDPLYIESFAQTSGALYGASGAPPYVLNTGNGLITATSTPSIITVAGTDVGPLVATASARGSSNYLLAIGSRAVSPEGAMARSSVRISQGVTNDTSDQLKVTFGYKIDAGSMSFTQRPFLTPPVAGNVLPVAQGNFSWEINVNGMGKYIGLTFGNAAIDSMGVMSASFSVPGAYSDPLYHNAASVLSGFSVSGGTASWSDTYITVELGVLNAGESLSYYYWLQGGVEAFSHTKLCNRAGPGEGAGSSAVGCILAELNAGDPGNLAPIDVTGNLIGLAFERLVGTVPEPAALGLLGLGVAGLSLGRRRMKKAA
jgi:hypothetical protein